MSDENTTPESGEPDEFEELIKNQPGPATAATISTLWEGVEHIWPQLHEGVLVKGIILAEYVDKRGKVLRWQTSPEMTPWDMMGMLHQAILDLESDSVGDSIASHLIGADDDDESEEEEEGEQ